MRTISRLTVIGTAMALVLLGAAPAFAAAPPSNDTFGGALTVGALPFSTTQDTTGATTDADDAQANAECGAPATDASVWYAVTATADGALLVDVSESSYSAGVLVTVGTPGSLSIVACGPEAVAFEVTAGTTYHLMMIDDQFDGGGNGGTLEMTVDTAPPPPVVDVAVNPTGTFNRQGVATISGTISCTGIVEFSFIDGELRQPVGRAIVVGFFSMEVVCDSTTRPWTAEVPPFYPGTRFAGGKTASFTFAVACGPVFCGTDYEERPVKLRRR